MTCGERIKFAREKRGLSQKELSERSGISRNNISAIETDAHGMMLYTACAIADALNVSLDFIAGRGVTKREKR